MFSFLWRAIKSIIKVITFIVVSMVIGVIPGYICMIAFSFVCWLFGIVITKTVGDIITILLILLLGAKIVAEMIGKI